MSTRRVLPPDIVERLVKVLGMLGSAHDGERAAAAHLAHKLVHDLGLTWVDVIASSPVEHDTSFQAKIDLLRDHPEELTPWERQFIIGVAGFRHPSERQRKIIDRVYARVRAFREAEAAA